jgi:hypothetical protein
MRELAEYQEHVLNEAGEGLATLRAFPTAAALVERIVAADERALEEVRALV